MTNKNMRQLERRPFVKIVDYSVSVLEFTELRSLKLKADIIDISDLGLGLRTTYPLEPGHVLRFNSGIGHRTGVIRWSMKDCHDETYRAGLSFK